MLPSQMGNIQKALSAPQGETIQSVQNFPQWNGSRSINEYQPKNATLLEEKMIER